MPKLSEPTRAQRRQELLEAGWRCLERTTFRDLSVAEICQEAGASKGAFYGYFDHKETYLLALLEDETAALDQVMEELERSESSPLLRLRGFAAAMLDRDLSQVQVRADLWAEMLTRPEVRRLLARAVEKRRTRLRGWVEQGISAKELEATPANALASLLLALGDGLSLHASLDQGAFRWPNIRQALDVLLAGLQPR